MNANGVGWCVIHFNFLTLFIDFMTLCFLLKEIRLFEMYFALNFPVFGWYQKFNCQHPIYHHDSETTQVSDPLEKANSKQ